MAGGKEPTQYVGVYLPGDEGEPIALFREGRHARMFVAGPHDFDPNAAVVATATDWDVNDTVAEQFASPAATPPEPGSTADPDARLRAEIRTQLEEDERRKRITSEVKAEMREDAKEDEPTKPAAAATAPAREREVRS
jgi:transposase-like protein